MPKISTTDKMVLAVEPFHVAQLEKINKLASADALDGRVELKESVRIVAAFHLLMHKRLMRSISPLFRQALRSFLAAEGAEIPSYERALEILSGNTDGRVRVTKEVMAEGG